VDSRITSTNCSGAADQSRAYGSQDDDRNRPSPHGETDSGIYSAGLDSTILHKAALQQQDRWIAFVARQIATDFLRSTAVKEDGTHD
jgi:hypothetical protein